MLGLILKGIGGFYYVLTEKGIIEAKGRGIFKRDGIALCVGDEVDIDITEEHASKGVICRIYPRKNVFYRPPICNVDLITVVFAVKQPEPNYAVIDKLLITAQMKKTEAIVCINKADLASEEEIERLCSIYDRAFTVAVVSANTGEGMDLLKELFKGKKTALAGPSGAGKSSITNLLHPQAEMLTGEISKKTKRGKHTTRHVELFSLENGGVLFDTPGFTSFELPEMEEDDLRNYYPEFSAFEANCRFDNCNHINEPDCAVKKAVSDGNINKSRYMSYLAIMNELKKRKKYR